MNQYFANTIERLECKNSSITELQIRTCALQNALDSKSLLEELNRHVEIYSGTRLKDELPFYYILIAYCYLFIDEYKLAEKYNIMAIEDFKICGMTWNEAIGHWFLGLIYRTEGRGYLFLTELNKTLTIINPIAAEYLIHGDYASAMKCDQVKKELGEQKTLAAKMGTGPLTAPEDKKQGEKATMEKNYLILPWIPVYQSVRGGTKGVVWVEPPPEKLIAVNEITIEDELYSLYVIKKTANTDHQIKPRTWMKYGWAKVEGNSMNGAHPVPIANGDYVLFYENRQPQDNDIVIASHITSSGDFAYMVKRYKFSLNQLISEPASSDTNPYSPITINQNHQFLGVVIATAKYLVK